MYYERVQQALFDKVANPGDDDLIMAFHKTLIQFDLVLNKVYRDGSLAIQRLRDGWLCSTQDKSVMFYDEHSYLVPVFMIHPDYPSDRDWLCHIRGIQVIKTFVASGGFNDLPRKSNDAINRLLTLVN